MPNKNERYINYLQQGNWQELSQLLTGETLQDGFLNLSLNQFATRAHPSTYFGGASPEGKAL